MLTNRFPPEGRLLHTPENRTACADCGGLRQAMESGAVLEGTALLCTPEHDLIVSLGPYQGVIPREEAALGIAEGATRDIAILSRVGKPVCFTVEALEERESLRLRQVMEQLRAWGTDCTALGSQVAQANPARWEKLRGEWEERFSTIPYEVSVQVSVSRTYGDLA